MRRIKLYISFTKKLHKTNSLLTARWRLWPFVYVTLRWRMWGAGMSGVKENSFIFYDVCDPHLGGYCEIIPLRIYISYEHKPLLLLGLCVQDNRSCHFGCKEWYRDVLNTYFKGLHFMFNDISYVIRDSMISSSECCVY